MANQTITESIMEKMRRLLEAERVARSQEYAAKKQADASKQKLETLMRQHGLSELRAAYTAENGGKKIGVATIADKETSIIDPEKLAKLVPLSSFLSVIKVAKGTAENLLGKSVAAQALKSEVEPDYFSIKND